MPSRAKFRARPRPIPEAAPVTIAVLPSSCCIHPPEGPRPTRLILWLPHRGPSRRCGLRFGQQNSIASEARMPEGRNMLRVRSPKDLGAGLVFVAIGGGRHRVRPGARVRLRGAHGAGLLSDAAELPDHRDRPRARREEPGDRRAAARAHSTPPAVRDPRRHPGVRLPDRQDRPRADRRCADRRCGLCAARREPDRDACCSRPASRCSPSASSSMR